MLPKLNKFLKKSSKSFSSFSSFFFNNIGFLGAPFNGGQNKEGTNLSPKILREFGIFDELKRMGLKIIDYGDLDFEHLNKPEINSKVFKNSNNFLKANKLLSDKICKITKENDLSITIGGDHSLGFGSIHGHYKTRENLSILWIDAHADINSINSTLTGNAHGMPVSFLINKLNKKYNENYIDELERFQLNSCISSQDIVYIGLRDVDKKEFDYLNEFKIKYYTMKHIDELGIKKVVELALEHLVGNKNNYLHVSFDIDAIDPIFAPSTGTPVPGGLTIREAYELAEKIYETKRLKALDIYEINPLIGKSRESLYARKPNEKFY